MARALGQIIRTLRKYRGYSQQSFADACGVHRTFMGIVERGETNLSLENLGKVATTLGITMSTLLEGLEKKVAQTKLLGKEAVRIEPVLDTPELVGIKAILDLPKGTKFDLPAGMIEIYQVVDGTITETTAGIGKTRYKLKKKNAEETTKPR